MAKTKTIIGVDPARNADDPAAMAIPGEDACDNALMDAAARIMAALVAKFGVTMPGTRDADQLSAAAQTYAKALVQRLRA